MCAESMLCTVVCKDDENHRKAVLLYMLCPQLVLYSCPIWGEKVYMERYMRSALFVRFACISCRQVSTK